MHDDPRWRYHDVENVKLLPLFRFFFARAAEWAETLAPRRLWLSRQAAEHENVTKPPETAAMVPVDIYSAARVAQTMLRGAEAGDVILVGALRFASRLLGVRSRHIKSWYQ